MAKRSPYSIHYLNMQFSAMRWLASQGVCPEDIREFRWGNIDETEKVVVIKKRIFNIKFDRSSKQIYQTEQEKPVKVPIKGSDQEFFFLKSKTPSHFWVFTEHFPKSWRREESKEALFPLETIESVCRDVKIQNTSPLTLIDKCANIEISKLNIHKPKNTELIEEAELVTEAED